MNKKNLVERVADKTDVNENLVEKVIDTLFDTIAEQLHNDVKIRVREFGQWFTEDYPERFAYSPSQGKLILIPPHSRVIFKPGSKLHTPILKS